MPVARDITVKVLGKGMVAPADAARALSDPQGGALPEALSTD
ncbi:hypothetical protein ACGFOU_16970 [Streptomyces sp. NPDC048595]